MKGVFMSEIREMYLDDVFSFGKFRDKSLGSVYSLNPGYVRWCEEKGIFRAINSNRPVVEDIVVDEGPIEYLGREYYVEIRESAF
jgi:hypothetical protein